MKTWFITGASRGLGREFALAALRRGDRVAATSRKAASLTFLQEEFGDRVLPLELQLTDAEAIKSAFAQAVATFGQIDILVNNAGYIQLGALEETTEQEARDEMEVLFWGPYHLTKEAVRHMRPRKSGTIVQVSSLAGIAGLPGNTMYAASKYALEGLSEALSREVASLGIRVLILEPAAIRTSIGGSVVASKPMPAYEDGPVGEQRNRWATGEDEHAKGNAERCAQALLTLLDAEKPPLRFLMGDSGAELGLMIYGERLRELQTWEALSRSLSDL